MSETTEVAIIGGGAAGCAVAFFLAEAGVSSTIIENAGISSQASGYAAGGLNPLLGRGIPGPLSEFTWESFQLHRALAPQLAERSGLDLQFRTVGHISLALDESELPDLEETIQQYSAAAGFKAHRLEPSEVAKLEPQLTGDFLQAVYTHGNGALDSLSFTQALAAAAHPSATVRPGRVCGLDGAGGRVERVLLEDGEIHCGQVVLALGPWSRFAERWLNCYIPVDPLKGEILRLKPPGGPFTHDIDGGHGSIYAKPDGLAWCGTTEDWRGFDRQPLAETRERVLGYAARLAPGLAGAEVVEHTACLRPVTPDWRPILGRAPGWDNAWLATGAGKKGILLAPAIGQSIAQLITAGQTPLPIDNLSPERFAQPGI